MTVLFQNLRVKEFREHETHHIILTKSRNLLKCALSVIMAPFHIFWNLWRSLLSLHDPKKEFAFHWSTFNEKDSEDLRNYLKRFQAMITEGLVEGSLSTTLQISLFLLLNVGPHSHNFTSQNVECFLSLTDVGNSTEVISLFENPFENKMFFNGPWFQLGLPILVFSIATGLFSTTSSQVKLYQQKHEFDNSNMAIYFAATLCITLSKALSQGIFTVFVVDLQVECARWTSLPLSILIYPAGIAAYTVIELAYTRLFHAIHNGM